MYLDFDEYQSMGGSLDASAFTQFERKAAYEINAQSAGKTGSRLNKLEEVPQAVKDCVFDLIEFMSNNSSNGKVITSESQSSGGVSESFSYAVLDDTQVQNQIDDIIYNNFYGGGIGDLLYRGLLPDDV